VPKDTLKVHIVPKVYILEPIRNISVPFEKYLPKPSQIDIVILMIH